MSSVFESKQNMEVPRMNLLNDIQEARRKAVEENPNYMGPLRGFGGKGADLVWKHMSEEGRKKWKEQNWPVPIILHPDGLKLWAEKFGKDIESM